ncbi:MAG: endonuclease/exonuclease/phosphatase family protein [Gammaproteobacteria bacterium]|nr:MAG: endonuclease/exonuclease/phosphatase family protein [Gammaproteobacteria bacterium]
MSVPAAKIIPLLDAGSDNHWREEAGQCQAQVPITTLRILTYNIQTGIATTCYRDYFTHSWKHVLPHAERMQNLDGIAHDIRKFDIVGLQEVDAGSLRSGFINQTEYLATRGHFPHWYHQTNRNLGKFAQHSLGVLSRIKVASVTEYKLPGLFPGRGAMAVELGSGASTVLLLIVHLALSQRARLQQLAALHEIRSEHENVIIMGDFNFPSDSKEMEWVMSNMDMREPIHGLHTFPSWRPFRNIDHIFLSPGLEVSNVKALNFPYSDHLPVAMEVNLPASLVLQAN